MSIRTPPRERRGSATGATSGPEPAEPGLVESWRTLVAMEPFW